MYLRIANAKDEPVPEGSIGRLQAKGETMFSGYYNNPAATKDSFTSDGWFKTGDLAFISNGRLTITGREKEVIRKNGVDYYCHEIESLVEQLPNVKPSFTAACSVGTFPSEKLAIFYSHTCQTIAEEVIFCRLQILSDSVR